MKPVFHTKNHLAIVYDADRIPEPDSRLLDPVFWETSGAVTGRTPGRGVTLMLATEFGPAVLRRYIRGGFPARLSRERYIFTGLDRSRPFCEFEMLRKMTEQGLPVPAPIAASVEHGWFTYRGAILMDRVVNSKTLAELLGTTAAASATWRDVGRSLRQIHSAGVDHADLNARNILVDENTRKVWLVDFDRCTFEAGKIVDGRQNLARLKRSLKKLWPGKSVSSLDDCWQALVAAYRE